MSPVIFNIRQCAQTIHEQSSTDHEFSCSFVFCTEWVWRNSINAFDTTVRFYCYLQNEENFPLLLPISTAAPLSLWEEISGQLFPPQQGLLQKLLPQLAALISSLSWGWLSEPPGSVESEDRQGLKHWYTFHTLSCALPIQESAKNQGNTLHPPNRVEKSAFHTKLTILAYCLQTSPIIWRKTKVWNQSTAADADWQEQCFIHYLIQTECRRNPNCLLLLKHNRGRADWKSVSIRTNDNTSLLERPAFCCTAGEEPSGELYHSSPTNF